MATMSIEILAFELLLVNNEEILGMKQRYKCNMRDSESNKHDR